MACKCQGVDSQWSCPDPPWWGAVVKHEYFRVSLIVSYLWKPSLWETRQTLLVWISTVPQRPMSPAQGPIYCSAEKSVEPSCSKSGHWRHDLEGILTSPQSSLISHHEMNGFLHSRFLPWHSALFQGNSLSNQGLTPLKTGMLTGLCQLNTKPRCVWESGILIEKMPP